MGKESNTPSLARLCQYDDLFTDILVDAIYYWAKVRKMKPNYLPNRRVKSEQVIKIIKEQVIGARNIAKAMELFLNLDGIKAFMSKLNDQEKSDFTKHARRYLLIYAPNTGFEVGTTCRFTFSPETKVIARKPYQKGEEFKNLSGILVPMTDEEEKEYKSHQRDFSILQSSRMNKSCLLLGPARFVNHDCKANARFVTTSKDLISLTATRDVEIGEEITACYSDHYFGENNCECLCVSCEEEEIGGFAPERPEGEETVKQEDVVMKDGGLTVPNDYMTTRSRSRTPDHKKGQQPKRVPPPLARTVKSESEEAEELANSLLILSQSPVSFTHPPIFRPEILRSPPSYASNPSTTSQSSTATNTTVTSIASAATNATTAPSSSTPQTPLTEATPSVLASPTTTTASKKRKSRSSTLTTPIPPRKRVPGDYREVVEVGIELVCADCDETFWNPDTWFVPRACKRCERHSKIYGLVWPKTYKHKRDDEEHYEDDRRIQRYITISEYRRQQKRQAEQEAKGKASVGRASSVASSARDAGSATESTGSGSVGRARKRRKSMAG